MAAFTGRFAVGIASPEARAVLAIASTPAAATKLSVTRIAAALRRAGRSRNIAAIAAEIQAELRKPQLRQPRLVETAMGTQALALLAALDTASTNVAELGEAPPSCSASLPITRSSPVSPVWPTRPVPGCSLRSAMTEPVSPTPEP